MAGAADPFEVLGVAPGLDLDAADLERRYLSLSRECHPDHHQQADATARVAVLERAAAVNEAYRKLRDPWLRARALIERADPAALEATKVLCPIFLTDALEQAEAVANATGADRDGLAAQIEASIDRCREELRAHVAGQRWKEAATVLHKVRYHRKALADLDERCEGAAR
jgi:molecular chaperone HscB